MALLRDTKARAKRIDLTYFRRLGPFGRWKRGLSIALPAAALAWVITMAARGDERIYNSGSISTRHGMLENQCGSCHTTPWALRYTAKAEWQEKLDAACLRCHDGPVHHLNAADLMRGPEGRQSSSRCSECHVEHKGSSHLAEVSDRNCVQCHADLKRTRMEAHPKACPAGIDHVIQRSVPSFEKGHPEFALITRKVQDPTRLAFNHAAHLHPDTSLRRDLFQKQLQTLAGKRGVESGKEGLSLACGYCHKTLPSGDSMAPISYEVHCRDCHPLKLEAEKLPHSAPDLLRDFLRSRMAKKGSAGDALNEKVMEAEIPIYTSDPDGCMKCHKTDLGTDFPAAPPVVALTGIRVGGLGQEGAPRRWYLHASFNHETHRELRCAECHAGADTSKLTSDLLMPSLAVCAKCHGAPGGVPATCVTCHRFHDRTRERSGEGHLQIKDVVK